MAGTTRLAGSATCVSHQCCIIQGRHRSHALMLGTSNSFWGGHGHDFIGGTLGSTQLSAASSEQTRAQQTWLRMFEQPPRARYRQVPAPRLLPDQPVRESYRQAPAALSLQDHKELPVVGADYDFIEPQEWPSDIVRVTNNVFCASEPYPVSRNYSNYRDECGCDGDRCVADHGVRSSSSCINVNQDIVCDDSICFIGPECGNRMQQRLALDLMSTSVGLGVLCDVAIPKDTFIIEYVGEVLLGPDARKRADKRYQVALRGKASWEGPVDIFIDTCRCGNESRFINHSCRPNCGLYELEWVNTSRLGIFAKTDIPPLRELTFQYTTANLSLFTCQCRHTNCISKHA